VKTYFDSSCYLNASSLKWRLAHPIGSLTNEVEEAASLPLPESQIRCASKPALKARLAKNSVNLALKRQSPPILPKKLGVLPCIGAPHALCSPNLAGYANISHLMPHSGRASREKWKRPASHSQMLSAIQFHRAAEAIL
jgi:hypothetical protein